MTLEPAAVMTYCHRRLGHTLSVEQAEHGAKQAEQQYGVLYKEHARRYTVELWNRRTAINGVPAKKVLATRDDIPETGDVYLIYHKGALLIFQPHDPASGGPIPPGEGKARGLAHVHEMVEESVRAAMLAIAATEACRS